MNAIVFEHVPVAELPAEWRAKLAIAPGATVTVRIEAEEDQGGAKASADDPIFLSCPRGKCRKHRLDAGLARMALTLASPPSRTRASS